MHAFPPETGFDETSVSREIIWFKKVDILEKSKFAALFCFIFFFIQLAFSAIMNEN